MLNNVQEILKHKVGDVIASPDLCFMLIRTYSKLYTKGEQISTCEPSLRKYYLMLKKDGAMKAEIQEKINSRTCVPAWSGLKYNTKIHTHISDKSIYDEQAIHYLNIGVLRESDFKVLPKGYKVVTLEQETTEENNTVQSAEPHSKKKAKKNKK